MFSKLFLAGSLGALILAGNVCSAAEPVKEGGTQYRAKQILGTKILIKGDTAIGTVDDLVFDDAGNLDYLIVENKGKLSTVPWEAAKFDVEKKMAVISITTEQYQAIPTYTTTTYPTFYAPTYRTQTYKYYGLAPRELRIFPRR